MKTAQKKTKKSGKTEVLFAKNPHDFTGEIRELS